MQVTLGAEPVLVYPVLQVHSTAFVAVSCEHNELESQPPLLTRQVSSNDELVKEWSDL